MISNLKDQLVRDEELRLKPYTDSVGKTSIGVGRNLTDKGISFQEAQGLLTNDIADATADLAAKLPWTATLDDVRKGALTNMCFNMGIGGLLSSTIFSRRCRRGISQRRRARCSTRSGRGKWGPGQQDSPSRFKPDSGSNFSRKESTL